MARRFERFEVKNEMRDGGKIRPDDSYKQNGGKTSSDQQKEIIEDAEKSGGFDDFDIEQDDIDFEEKNESEIEKKEVVLDEKIEANKQIIELKLDENDNPVMPEGWTFLTHGSSLERWDSSILGNDFVVGNGIVNGRAVSGRPLCCVERNVAKYDYETSGSNTAKSYGGKNQAFQIRVLYYKNPRTGAGKIVREKLSPEQISKVNKCYMYQGGRHPAVPVGTKLSFIKSSDFDEITNTNGNNILWYIPEEYLQQYLEDLEKIQDIDKSDTQITEDNEIQQETGEIETPTITNLDAEQELKEYYTDDVTIPEIEAYLSEKISQVYGDRLGNAGIFNVRKFLEGKLNDFQGIESYKEIIEELESTLEAAENVHNQESPEIEQGEKNVEETVQEEITVEEPIQEETGFVLTSINGKSLNELTTMYQNAGINKSDLQVARNTLARTKEEREQSVTHSQTQPNKDNSEGR